MKYNKILIVGGIGSGKTTLANKISKKFKIKAHELDNISYKRRDIHEKRTPKARDNILKSILKKKKWVIEGFYSRAWTYPVYRQADIVIIMNIKAPLAKKRLVRRFVKRKLSPKKRRDVNQSFKRMLSLVKYVEEYPKYFKMQKQTAERFNKNVLILNNKKEVDEFFKKLK